MKKLFSFCKRCLTLTLVLVMVLGSIDMTAIAAINAHEDRIYFEGSFENNVYYPDLQEDGEIPIIGEYTSPTKYSAANDNAIRAAAENVRDNMLARNEKFTINIMSPRNDYTALVTEIVQLATSKELATTSAAGDYLAWHYGGYKYTGSAGIVDNLYDYSFNFDVNYYTTAKQEEQVTIKIKNALDEMNINSLTDYQKTKAVYDYVCAVCDYNHRRTDDYLKFTAYGALIDGTAVCQGYATLLYRMLQEANIENKIITSEDHCWNIVQIDKKFYNVDVTWDDNYYNKGLDYAYFLKCNEHFKDHIREPQYTTELFNINYTMVNECYFEQQETVDTAVLSDAFAVANGFTAQWNKTDDATGYQLQYATKADFTNGIAVDINDANAVSYTVTGLAEGTGYYARLRAYKLINGKYIWGNWSENKHITTPARPKATTLASVTAVANGFTAKWNKGADAAGYQIQYATKADFTNGVTVYGGAANTLSKTVTDLADNTRYYVRVRTYKIVNNTYVWGNWSAYMYVNTPAKPKATTLASVTAVANGFTAKWNKGADAVGYQIQYATKADFTNGVIVYGGAANTLSKTITGLADNTRYYVRVRTYKTVNSTYVWGDWSAYKYVNTPAKPKATTLASVTAVANGFTAKWNKGADAVGYQIQYATKADFTNGVIVYGGAANTLSKTVTGLAANTRYYVRVRTYKTVAGTYVWGDWSAYKYVNTPAKPRPTAITAISAVSKGFTVKWNKATDTAGYQVQYATKADFTNGVIVYGGAANTLSKTVTGLGANTRYYVRVRTYKVVAGTYVWGDWSAAKVVTTKK